MHDPSGPSKSDADPKGINVQVHYVKGFAAARHIRIAVCCQMGQDILLQDNGQMCFFVTRGVTPDNRDAHVGEASIVGAEPGGTRP